MSDLGLELKIEIEGVSAAEIRKALGATKDVSVTEKRGLGGVVELLVIVGIFVANRIATKATDKALDAAVDGVKKVARVVRKKHEDSPKEVSARVSVSHVDKTIDTFSIEGMTDDEVTARLLAASKKANAQPGASPTDRKK